MQIEEFYQLKAGDKVIKKGKVFVIKLAVWNNWDVKCFDAILVHKIDGDRVVLCSRLNYNIILHSLTKIKS